MCACIDFVLDLFYMFSLYKIGTCFNCQKCLYCFIDLSQETCNCNITKKPLRSDKNIDCSKKNFQVYNRDVSSTIHPTQLPFLEEANEKFEYEQDFITEFDVSFCSACNSKYERSKTRKIKKTSQANTQVQDKENLTQINIQVIIKKNNESSPGKWIKLNVLNSTLFYEDLLEYMNKNNENSISKDNYTITYKVNGRGQVMALDDNDDFVAFFEKYKGLSGSQHMVIYVNINIKSNNFKNKYKRNISVSKFIFFSNFITYKL